MNDQVKIRDLTPYEQFFKSKFGGLPNDVYNGVTAVDNMVAMRELIRRDFPQASVLGVLSILTEEEFDASPLGEKRYEYDTRTPFDLEIERRIHIAMVEIFKRSYFRADYASFEGPLSLAWAKKFAPQHFSRNALVCVYADREQFYRQNRILVVQRGDYSEFVIHEPNETDKIKFPEIKQEWTDVRREDMVIVIDVDDIYRKFGAPSA